MNKGKKRFSENKATLDVCTWQFLLHFKIPPFSCKILLSPIVPVSQLISFLLIRVPNYWLMFNRDYAGGRMPFRIVHYRCIPAVSIVLYRFDCNSRCFVPAFLSTCHRQFIDSTSGNHFIALHRMRYVSSFVCFTELQQLLPISISVGMCIS